MPKHKVVRKTTPIDMTAMCDVAFLLLSFFILTTKFKPSEALAVVTPNSVSNKVAEQKDAVLITIDKDGKVKHAVGRHSEGSNGLKEFCPTPRRESLICVLAEYFEHGPPSRKH